MITRKETKKVFVKDVQIGGQNKVVIQSMTNTKTKDITATIKQIKNLELLGCEIVRVAILDFEDAEALKEISKKVNIPIVADIHYNYKLALASILNGADKIRINPGNIGNKKQLKEIVLLAKEKNIPIRIGINSGSLEKSLLIKYGQNNPKALVISAKRIIKYFETLGFFNIVVSLKSSDVLTTIEAYLLASKTIKYPLHIGVTEAGGVFTSSIRSSAGLAPLLYKGIGDTIRISVSAEPEKEIRICKELLRNFNLIDFYPKLISCPTCGRIQWNALPIYEKIEEYLQNVNKNIVVALMGCSVNGLIEGKHADIGFAGTSQGGILFKKGIEIKKVPEDLILTSIIEEIEKF